MTDKKFFEKTMVDELPRFERVLKAIPNKLKDLRAHPKNQNAEEIIRTLVFDSISIPTILETGEFDFGEESKMDSGTTSDMAMTFKENLKRGHELVSKMSEKEWEKPAKLMMNGKVMWKATAGEAVWGTLFDMIHHRGQLSTHIRPQGGKVPSIYGPSGDSET
jgi:uncharacterized damage-inducible protein DinB